MSSKFTSPHFSGTNGATLNILSELFDTDEPTATIWQHIEATQPEYPNTKIPRSFLIKTNYETLWTHGNATEHMYEAVMSLNLEPMLKNTNPNLFTQFILYDYRNALNEAIAGGIRYGQLVNSGHWIFKFPKNHEADKNPVVIHSLFTGLK